KDSRSYCDLRCCTQARAYPRHDTGVGFGGMNNIGGIGEFWAVRHKRKPSLFQIGADEALAEVSITTRCQDVVESERPITDGYDRIGLIRKRCLITRSKFIPPIYLYPVFQRERLIDRRRACKNKLFFKE